MIELTDVGTVEDAVEFGSGERLTYKIVVARANRVHAAYEDGQLRVILPNSTASRWSKPDEVSVRDEQDVGDGETLTILLEKDFACFVQRDGEDETDLFPNPNSSHA
jgi:hypothetical protein